MYFSDLHCHPTGMNFPRFSIEDPTRLQDPEAHPWFIEKANKGKLAKGRRATGYSQSDWARLIHGNVKLVIASLYPFEHGFINHIRKAPIGDPDKYSSWLDLRKSPPGLTTSAIMSFTKDRIYYMRDDAFDYWNELRKEYEFFLRKSGVEDSARIEHDQDGDLKIRKGEKRIDVSGRYWVVARDPDNVDYQNPREPNVGFKGADFINQVDNEPNQTATILTIEGMHSLSMSNQAVQVSDEELMNRINTIKQWDPPILFVTFGHHFDNRLCSHAHSLFRVELVGDWNPDQSVNMDYITYPTENPSGDKKIGLTQLGYKAMLALLHLKEESGQLVDNTADGHRILIDTKHMSASARYQMYNDIIKPYNEGKSDDDKIPVIASHSAYSGIVTLEQMMDRYEFEEDDFFPERMSEFLPGYGFNPWNINVSDEDIHIICETRGLLGISFDERVLGLQDKYSKDDHWNNIDIIVNNLLGIAHAAKAVNMDQYSSQHNVWDCICIGTDFNGFVDPVNQYPTAVDFGEFAEDLKKQFDAGVFSAYGINSGNSQEVVEKMAIENIRRFVVKHF